MKKPLVYKWLNKLGIVIKCEAYQAFYNLFAKSIINSAMCMQHMTLKGTLKSCYRHVKLNIASYKLHIVDHHYTNY